MKRASIIAFQLACVVHAHGFLETKTHMQVCMQPRDAGPCKASIPSWYFNAYEQACKEFIYGGCKGNNNRFESRAACEAACSHMKNKEQPCTQPPETGPCRALMLNWFFDKRTGVCKVFVYGGCGGNSNRFATELECQATCLPTSKELAICSLDPQLERCTAQAQLWYFDPNEDTCHRCARGFCGRSANKFATCKKCMNRCSGANAVKTCSLAYRKIHYGVQGITWPGKTEPRVRGPGVRAPSHPDVLLPSINTPGGFKLTQSGTRERTLVITPTSETGLGATGLTRPVDLALGLGGSGFNNNGQERAFPSGPSFPGYSVKGPGSTRRGHEVNVQVGPLSPRPPGLSAPAPGLAGSPSGAPNITHLAKALPAGIVMAGQPAAGVAAAVPTLTGSYAHAGPGLTMPLKTVPTKSVSGVLNYRKVSSASAPMTHRPSSVAAVYGQQGTYLTGTVASATAQTRGGPRDTPLRGSSLKSPPFTIPAHFLLKV